MKTRDDEKRALGKLAMLLDEPRPSLSHREREQALADAGYDQATMSALDSRLESLVGHPIEPPEPALTDFSWVAHSESADDAYWLDPWFDFEWRGGSSRRLRLSLDLVNGAAALTQFKDGKHDSTPLCWSRDSHEMLHFGRTGLCTLTPDRVRMIAEDFALPGPYMLWEDTDDLPTLTRLRQVLSGVKGALFDAGLDRLLGLILPRLPGHFDVLQSRLSPVVAMRADAGADTGLPEDVSAFVRPENNEVPTRLEVLAVWWRANAPNTAPELVVRHDGVDMPALAESHRESGPAYRYIVEEPKIGGPSWRVSEALWDRESETLSVNLTRDG